MSLAWHALSALRRIVMVIAIGVAFLFGLATTVYLSLLSPEVRVPEVIGKDRFEAENILISAGLNYRVRATRPSNNAKPDTVLFQLPRAGEVVKAGQTVALDISRAAKAGESSEAQTTDERAAEEKSGENRNTSANENENRVRRPRPVNRNTNEDANANSNASVNANRTRANENANRLDPSGNRNVNAGTNANVNRSGTGVNENSTRRPPAPKPSPTSQTPGREN